MSESREQAAGQGTRLIIGLGLLASLITIFGFVTGQFSVQQLGGRLEEAFSSEERGNKPGSLTDSSTPGESPQVASGAIPDTHSALSLASGLRYIDLRLGTGQRANWGDNVVVHYSSWLATGGVVDSSYDRGQPFSFAMNGTQVIPGFEEGLVGMKIGGKRRLIIPPELAYGDRDLPSIPPSSTLIFEVELLEVK